MEKTILSSSDKLIISNLLDQAEYYLLELGEFYPFGTLLKNGRITPFSIHNGSNQPNIDEMIVEYDKYAIEGLAKKDFDSCGIAIEVLVNGEDGILIKLFNDFGMKQITIFYTIKADTVDFKF